MPFLVFNSERNRLSLNFIPCEHHQSCPKANEASLDVSERSVLCFCVPYRLRDGWTYWAETWWDGRGHMREQLQEGFLLFVEFKMATKLII